MTNLRELYYYLLNKSEVFFPDQNKFSTEYILIFIKNMQEIIKSVKGQFLIK